MITLLFNHHIILRLIITNEGIIYIMILILIYYLKPNNKPCLLASSYDGIRSEFHQGDSFFIYIFYA